MRAPSVSRMSNTSGSSYSSHSGYISNPYIARSEVRLENGLCPNVQLKQKSRHSWVSVLQRTSAASRVGSNLENTGRRVVLELQLETEKGRSSNPRLAPGSSSTQVSVSLNLASGHAIAVPCTRAGSISNFSLTGTLALPKPIKIDMDDIIDEIRFWESDVVCYVIGANPRLHVIEGFTRRICSELDIDKIGMVEKGVFLIRFKTQEDCISACGMSGIMFDKKHFIVKPWSPSMSY